MRVSNYFSAMQIPVKLCKNMKKRRRMRSGSAKLQMAWEVVSGATKTHEVRSIVDELEVGVGHRWDNGLGRGVPHCRLQGFAGSGFYVLCSLMHNLGFWGFVFFVSKLTLFCDHDPRKLSKSVLKCRKHEIFLSIHHQNTGWTLSVTVCTLLMGWLITIKLVYPRCLKNTVKWKLIYLQFHVQLSHRELCKFFVTQSGYNSWRGCGARWNRRWRGKSSWLHWIKIRFERWNLEVTR